MKKAIIIIFSCGILLFYLSFTPDTLNSEYNKIIKLSKKTKSINSNILLKITNDSSLLYLKNYYYILHDNNYGVQIIIYGSTKSNISYYTALFFKNEKYINSKRIEEGRLVKQYLKYWYGDYSYDLKDSCLCFYSYRFNKIDMDNTTHRIFSNEWINTITDSLIICNKLFTPKIK